MPFSLNCAHAYIASGVISLRGRRLLARAARALTNIARLDLGNDIGTNGELLVQKIVLSVIPRDSPLTIFDIGANVGEWTKPLIRSCNEMTAQNIQIHAFEPVSSTMRLLRTNIADMSSVVHLVNKAVSDTTGSTTMSIIADGAGTNALIPDPSQSIRSLETVATVTIDGYCEEQGIAAVALVKVDTEGHDLAVLRGAERMLSERAIGVIQFEYNWRWILQRAYLRDAFNLANTVGYNIGKVTRLGIEFYDMWNIELETFREGNYLFCRPDWVRRFPTVHW